MASIAVGLVDSGVSGSALQVCDSSRGFLRDESGRVRAVNASPDSLGHGTALADTLLRGVPTIRLLSAQVFNSRLNCSAGQVAAALEWLLSQRVQLVNMSFGLRENREVLRQACARAVAEGVILVASSPARGDPVYPASYPGVVRATGDARCGPGEISLLQTEQADFGAPVRCAHSDIAGASVGCANISALVAEFLSRNPGSDSVEVYDFLAARASYRGPERRTL